MNKSDANIDVNYTLKTYIWWGGSLINPIAITLKYILEAPLYLGTAMT